MNDQRKAVRAPENLCFVALSLSVAFLIVCTYVPVAYAENSAGTSSASAEALRTAPPAMNRCKIGVRMIEAKSRTAKAKNMKLETGEYLNDVKDQLQPLPFASYRVIDSSEKMVELGTETEFSLIHDGKAHTLHVEPCWKQGERVQVMVDWTSPEGENLLSTKLEIVRGKNVVVGTDMEGEMSEILCIKVDC